MIIKCPACKLKIEFAISADSDNPLKLRCKGCYAIFVFNFKTNKILILDHKHHYDELGLSGTETEAEVKTRFQNIIKLIHPDKNPAGLERSKRINTAYAGIKEDIRNGKFGPRMGPTLNKNCNANIYDNYIEKNLNIFDEFYSYAAKMHQQDKSRFEGFSVNKHFEAIRMYLNVIDSLFLSGNDPLGNNSRHGKYIKQIVLIRWHLQIIASLLGHNDKRLIMLRDTIVESLYRFALELANKCDKYDDAYKILIEAEKIAIIKRGIIQESVRILKGNIELEEILKPIRNAIVEGDSDKAYAYITNALQSPKIKDEYKAAVEQLKKSLDERVRDYGSPIRSAPTLSTLNGIGTQLYGDTVYFVVLFLPLFPLARYSVLDTGAGKYQFYGKLELKQWQKIWRYVILGIIVIAAIVIALDSKSKPAKYFNIAAKKESSKIVNPSQNIKTPAVKIDTRIEKNLMMTNEYIENERNKVHNLENEILNLRNEIESILVDNSSQESVDVYNGLVNIYNMKLNTYEKMRNNFNSIVKTYNDAIKNN